jgi:hypothetical protein
MSGAATAMVMEKTAMTRSAAAETTPIALPRARRWICSGDGDLEQEEGLRLNFEWSRVS